MNEEEKQTIKADLITLNPGIENDEELLDVAAEAAYYEHLLQVVEGIDPLTLSPEDRINREGCIPHVRAEVVKAQEAFQNVHAARILPDE